MSTLFITRKITKKIPIVPHFRTTKKRPKALFTVFLSVGHDKSWGTVNRWTKD